MHELFKLEDITQDEMIMTKAYPKYKLSLCTIFCCLLNILESKRTTYPQESMWVCPRVEEWNLQKACEF